MHSPSVSLLSLLEVGTILLVAVLGCNIVLFVYNFPGLLAVKPFGCKDQSPDSYAASKRKEGHIVEEFHAEVEVSSWLMCIDKILNKLMTPRPSINQFSSSWLDKKEAHPVPIPWIL